MLYQEMYAIQSLPRLCFLTVANSDPHDRGSRMQFGIPHGLSIFFARMQSLEVTSYLAAGIAFSFVSSCHAQLTFILLP
jgi:hypothetical protein